MIAIENSTSVHPQTTQPPWCRGAKLLWDL